LLQTPYILAKQFIFDLQASCTDGEFQYTPTYFLLYSQNLQNRLVKIMQEHKFGEIKLRHTKRFI